VQSLLRIVDDWSKRGTMSGTGHGVWGTNTMSILTLTNSLLVGCVGGLMHNSRLCWMGCVGGGSGGGRRRYGDGAIWEILRATLWVALHTCHMCVRIPPEGSRRNM